VNTETKMSGLWKVEGFRWGNYRLLEVTPTRTTTNRVYVGGRFESKSSDYHEYFESRAEAVAFIRAHAEKKIADANAQIEKQQQALRDFQLESSRAA
jgi:hypothetical protein